MRVPNLIPSDCGAAAVSPTLSHRSGPALILLQLMTLLVLLTGSAQAAEIRFAAKVAPPHNEPVSFRGSTGLVERYDIEVGVRGTFYPPVIGAVEIDAELSALGGDKWNRAIVGTGTLTSIKYSSYAASSWAGEIKASVFKPLWRPSAISRIGLVLNAREDTKILRPVLGMDRRGRRVDYFLKIGIEARWEL